MGRGGPRLYQTEKGPQLLTAEQQQSEKWRSVEAWPDSGRTAILTWRTSFRTGTKDGDRRREHCGGAVGMLRDRLGGRVSGRLSGIAVRG